MEILYEYENALYKEAFSIVSINSRSHVAFKALQRLGVGKLNLNDFGGPKSYRDQIDFIEGTLPFLKEGNLETIADAIKYLNET